MFALLGLILFPFKVLTSLLFFILMLVVLIWLYGDAERRGKSGCLVVLLAFIVFWPVGLVLWLFFRPAYPESFRDDYRR